MNDKFDNLPLGRYQLPIYEVIVGSDQNAINRVSIVEVPAIESNFIKLNQIESIKLSRIEDKRHIIGPALIPNKPIYRRDENGYEYLIYFSEATIEKLAISFFKSKEINGVDINHSQIPTGYLTLVSSYLINSNLKDDRFNLPSGSWILEYKVEDEDFWYNEIVSGNLTGYSIDGVVNFVKVSNAHLSKVDNDDLSIEITNVLNLL